jgi:lipopolysaccharide exporter
MNKAKKSLLAGTLLVANALLKKAIGLISTLILARVLAPDDFGLVAITMLVLGFLEVFAVTGSQQYIYQKEDVTKEILDTAWTIDLILKFIIAITLFISADLIASYYEDEQLIGCLRVIAIIPILGALKNPGLLLLEKQQMYGAIIKQSILIKVFAVSVTIVLALSLRNFWALIWGSVFVSLLECLGSYYLHPHRPTICLTNSKPQLIFSGWMTPQAIIGYLRTQLDTFIVSTYYGKAQLGSYHVMKYLAFMPTSEVITPATQPLLVELSKVKNDPKGFEFQYNLSLLIVMAVALPMAIFLFSFDVLFVDILLGKQWLQFSEVFGVMSLMVVCFVLLNQARRALVVFERTKLMFYYEVASFTFIYGSIFLIGISDIITFTRLRVGLELASCMSLFTAVSIHAIGLRSFIRLIFLNIPLLVSVFLADFCTRIIHLPDYPALINLPIYLIIFVSLYLFFLVISHQFYYCKTDEGKKIKMLISSSINSVFQKK